MYGGVAALALGTAVLLPVAVSADQISTTGQDTFIQKLAAKLGLTEEVVETAVTSTRDEMKTEIDTARATAITDAVTAGTLTQRQADILNAIDDAQESIRSSKTQEDMQSMRDLTPDERKTQMDEELLAALNDAGLNTTADEVSAAREAAQSADIMVGGPRGGMGEGRGGFGGPGGLWL